MMNPVSEINTQLRQQVFEYMEPHQRTEFLAIVKKRREVLKTSKDFDDRVAFCDHLLDILV